MAVIEDRKAQFVNEFLQRVYVQKDLSSLGHYVDKNITWSSQIGSVHGAGAFKQYIEGYIETYPDFKIEVIDSVTQGEKVAIRFYLSGTFSKDFFGVHAKSRFVKYEGMAFIKLENDKIKEGHICLDMYTFLTQLSVIEPVIHPLKK